MSQVLSGSISTSNVSRCGNVTPRDYNNQGILNLLEIMIQLINFLSIPLDPDIGKRLNARSPLRSLHNVASMWVLLNRKPYMEQVRIEWTDTRQPITGPWC